MKEISFSQPLPYNPIADAARVEEQRTSTTLDSAHTEHANSSRAEFETAAPYESLHVSPPPKFRDAETAEALYIPTPQLEFQKKPAMRPAAEPVDASEPITASRQPVTSSINTNRSDPPPPTSPNDLPASKGSTTPSSIRDPHLPSTSGESENDSQGKFVTLDPVKRSAHRTLSDQLSVNKLELESLDTIKDENPASRASSQYPRDSQRGVSSNDSANAAMVPPYSGVGSVRRTSEARNPRPAYLKERKSTWLTDTVAAPADGIITPDWFEHL